ncbi:mannose-1-phosphate guanylyltransferase/mannose-6-phosphate isomerase, partial [Enterobacter hormaechei]|nr:mannose-1-phosphate guanylyltransferase/mannose-6-phosphate isomerase [Enterobacter hormaechei]EMC2285939.1 mannose-1-phosphate guanylyltransferase/mannose-6-phosphate isomerase [Enterobacter hormaechei]HCR0800000.1 mannose-1-phosphate guanylyltransferase/mannose-6-phosphate isomerase [Enterobacter hormaechei]HDT3543902.1 mannose-1-phosphate guanylyltransferase/mannose-6-phosphate isomerase [Enterobacter hormaechei subsp. steigerwaltii]
MILPIVIAGGTGSRLWPLSRSQYPKQFLSLLDENSLLQNTLSRLKEIKHAAPVVICNEEHRFIVAEQLRDAKVDVNGIILEPIGKNTAPAVALAAFFSKKIKESHGDDPLLLILAADHVIKDVDKFKIAIEHALPLAKQGKIVTFGVVPTHPETGYGYIQTGEFLAEDAYGIISFKEKPDLQTARNYVKSKGFLWNSGMFLFRASSYLQELKKYHPEIYDICSASIASAKNDLDFTRVDREIFSLCKSESIDYAVMEKTDKGVVISLDAGWSDVGSWSSLWEIDIKNEDYNVIHGDVIAHNSINNYIYSESALVATVGIQDLIVVQTKDAILIAQKSECQDVKNIVERLNSSNRQEYRCHHTIYRPWGKYDSIDAGERYQVKRITVKPGEGLSVQMHHHRAEHWVVVAGTAKVTIDGEVKLLGENESIYIPLGATHCL